MSHHGGPAMSSLEIPGLCAVTGELLLGGFMHYEQFTKKLATPAGFTVPTRLRFGNIEARAITRADLAEDVRGINDSLELIARTRGGGWPTEPVTEAINFV